MNTFVTIELLDLRKLSSPVTSFRGFSLLPSKADDSGTRCDYLNEGLFLPFPIVCLDEVWFNLQLPFRFKQGVAEFCFEKLFCWPEGYASCSV